MEHAEDLIIIIIIIKEY